MGTASTNEIVRLEALMASGPGAEAFPALAEAYRRSGQAQRAVEVAMAGLEQCPEHVGGRVALGLALLDLGRADQARKELEAALDATPGHLLAQDAVAALAEPGSEPEAGPLDALDEAELDAAFAAARPEQEAMLGAHDAAEQAVRRVEADGLGESLDPGGDSPFATETVADLLEKQGDRDRASALREVLARRQAGSLPMAERRSRVIHTLERWLDRLGRHASR